MLVLKTKYSQWLRNPEVTEDPPQHTLDSTRPTQNNERPFSQNPQEPEIPPLLTFAAEATKPSASYAQATTRSKQPTAPTMNSSTQLSTLTSDKFRDVENDVNSLREGWKEMKHTLDQMQTTMVSIAGADTGMHNGNPRTLDKPDDGVQLMIQEVLKRLANNHTTSQARFDNLESSSQARFDSLEDQQEGTSSQLVDMTLHIDDLSGTMDQLRDANIKLRKTNEAIMDRMDHLEGSAPYGSPVRKQRSHSDATTADNTQRSMQCDDMDELHEIPVRPGTPAGQQPASRS